MNDENLKHLLNSKHADFLTSLTMLYRNKFLIIIINKYLISLCKMKGHGIINSVDVINIFIISYGTNDCGRITLLVDSVCAMYFSSKCFLGDV